MSDAPDHSFTSIADIGTSIRAGRLSSPALTERCLARIEAINPALNAFITVTGDLARDQAETAQADARAGRWKGALHGVPVAIKDFYDTAGIRTTAGFEHFEHRLPSRDAEMVTRLRTAGAVLVGKTNMHKLGMGTTSLDSHFGEVVNPWNAKHVAGGSSGGSAAAVAAGLCFATVDTDAIGSGRLPAAICGVVCFKPTFRVLSTDGVLAGEQADPAILLLSHPCVMARSADDVTAAFEALTNLPVREMMPVRTAGVVTNCAASGGQNAALERVAVELAGIGKKTRNMEVPFAAASFDVSAITHDRATINETLFRDVDVLVLPTLTGSTPTVDEARERGSMAVSADNTFFCNYFGLPAITVPCGVDMNGMPLGVQFVGPRGGDAAVLALAREYQRATGRGYTPPPRFA